MEEFSFLPGCKKRQRGVCVRVKRRERASDDCRTSRINRCANTDINLRNSGIMCTVIVRYSVQTHTCTRFSSRKFTSLKISLFFGIKKAIWFLKYKKGLPLL